MYFLKIAPPSGSNKPANTKMQLHKNRLRKNKQHQFK